MGLNERIIISKRAGKKAQVLASVLPDILKELKNYISFSNKIIYRIEPLYDMAGEFIFKNKLCRLNSRVDIIDFISYTIHEMTHAEQDFTKRLEFVKNQAYWEGKKVKIKGINDNGYRRQPWEIEAYRKEYNLLIPVANALQKKGIFNVDE